MDKLDQAIEEDRLAHGKKPLPPPSSEPQVREIKQSKTDPESGFMTRDNKPKGFFYLDHRTVDIKANIITDAHVTAVFDYRRPPHRQGYLRKREFIYIAETDQYVCPQGQALIYSTTNWEGYRHYVSDPAVCRQCPLISRCTQNAKQQKNSHPSCMGGQ